MQDRVPLYPGRVSLTPVSGNIYDMTMADQPQVVGTPLNKANLLSDAAAAAVWPDASDRPSDPVPSDAFIALAPTLLCDYTNTASISSSSGASITLADNIDKYKKLDIWIVSTYTYSGPSAREVYIDVGNAISSNSRIAQANLKTEVTPNPIHLVTLLLDNSTSGHLVLSDISRGYPASTYPDPNIAFSGTGKLSGNKLTLSASTSVDSGKLRVVIIGYKF